MLWHYDVELSTDPRTDNTDRYGRLLRYVGIDGHDVGLAMIQQGRASAYYPHSAHAPERDQGYRTAQKAAQTAGRGQWSTCTPAQATKR